MTATYKTISKYNFIAFCKDTIPSVKNFEVKLKKFEKSGVEIDYFPEKKKVGKRDRFWTQNLFTAADMVSYGCILCRYPNAIQSVTINFNGNFFATEHVCNVRVFSTIQEYEEKFAHSFLKKHNRWNNSVLNQHGSNISRNCWRSFCAVYS